MENGTVGEYYGHLSEVYYDRWSARNDCVAQAEDWILVVRWEPQGSLRQESLLRWCVAMIARGGNPSLTQFRSPRESYHPCLHWCRGMNRSSHRVMGTW